MNSYKSIFASTTFWGGVVALLAVIFPRFVTPSDTAQVGSIVTAIVGFITVIYGRVTANKKVTLTGKPPKGAHRASLHSHYGILLLALLILPFTTGCPKDNYRKAAIASRDFAIAVQTVQKSETALHDQQQVSDAEHKAFADAFTQVAQTGLQMNQVIRAGDKASNADAQAVLNQAFTSTQKLLDDGVGNIKNAQVKAALAASIVAARGYLTTIAVLIQTKKGGQVEPSPSPAVAPSH